VDVGALGVEFLTLAGHKLYAPKGVGALYVRDGVDLPVFMHGAGHEGGRRAGTENVLEIVGLGRACELAAARIEESARHCAALRDRLWEILSGSGIDIRRNGSVAACLPNTLSVSFRGVEASTLLAEIGDQVAASAGAACHGAETRISHVLEAMRVPADYASGTVRFSVGRPTTEPEIEAAATIVLESVRRLGAGAPAPAAAGASRGEVRLTRFTRGMGCACKLPSADLEKVLRALPAPRDPRVLVGIATSDDAAVFRLRDDLAVVQTVDFFTPIVDDPFDFGAVSAANSLSDVYAMGAEPLFALNIVAFPTSRLPLEVLERILAGAAEVAREAGIALIGGHSIEDPEPKFGLAVTGTVHPDRVVTNAGARPGDRLILTKPLGTGVIATAVKQDAAAPPLAARARDLMRRLNGAASRAMLAHGATACTDVTGFGLLGHLREMAAGARLDVVIEPAKVPVIDGAEDLAAAGFLPGGSRRNLECAAAWVEWRSRPPVTRRQMLADAQTSGGLLIAVAATRASGLLEAIRASGDPEAAIIGSFTGPGSGRIVA
jgi:selenium donor protein